MLENPTATAPPAPRERTAAPGGVLANLGAERITMLVCIATLGVLILYPLVMLLARSVQAEDLSAFTLANYASMLSNPRIPRAMANSLLVSFGGMLLATVLGVSLAWITERIDTPGSTLLRNLNLIPYFTSPFVGSIAWIFLASRNNGLLNRWAIDLLGTGEPLLNIYGAGGVIWVLGLFDAPIVYLFTIAAFRKIDPSLEEAARISGSGLLGTALRVSLPLATPSILSAALLVFISSMGSFEVPLAIGLPGQFNVLTTELFGVISDYPVRYNFATAISTLLMTVCGLALVFQRRVLLRRQFITITGKGYRPDRLEVGRWRWLALAWNLFYLLVAVVLPLYVLLMVSLQNVWTGSFRFDQVSLKNFQYVLFDYDLARRSIVNSLILAVLGATLGTALGVIAATLVFRGQLAGRSLLDLLTALPASVPAVILAIGVVISWIRTPLYGTLWIMLIAYVARYVPFAQRSVSAALLSISPELEECSRVSGGSWWTTLRRVTLPLARHGIIAGWVLLFIVFVREFGMSLLLYGTGTETMSVALFSLLRNNATSAAALSLVLTAILLGAVVVLRSVSRGDEYV